MVQSDHELNTDQVQAPVPAMFARIGLVAIFVSVCLPGFLVSFPQVPSLGPLSEIIFLVGLVFLASSIITAAAEGVSVDKRLWVPVGALLISALLPVINQNADFPGDNNGWFAAHVALICVLLSARFFSFRFIAGLLRLGMLASILTLVGGAAALSADERSLFPLVGRLRGVFHHPNMTGLVAVAFLLLSLRRSRWQKIDILLSLLVIASAVSLTSWVAVGLGLCAWYVRGVAARFCTVAIGLLTLFVPAFLVLVMGPSLSPDLFTGRSGAWQWVLSLRIDPLTGEGIGFFRTLGAGKLVEWDHGHNQLIMDYVSGGWPLVLTTVLILGSFGISAATRQDRLPLVMWCILIVQCVTEIPMFFTYPSGLMLSTTIIIVLISGGANDTPIPVQRPVPKSKAAHVGGASG